MPFQGSHQFAVQSPNLDRTVGAARGEQVSIRTEGNTPSPTLMSLQSLEWFAIGTPQANGAGLRPRVEPVNGSRAVPTNSARPVTLGMQAAERVTATLAAAVAERRYSTVVK